jgi:tetratricopeptide (TPR) repeat protein
MLPGRLVLPGPSLSEGRNCTDSVLPPDGRIAACTNLLNARLPPRSLAVVLGSRGAAYLAKQQYDSALADFDQAIRLDPSRGLIFAHRGAVRLAKGDNEGAAQDLDEAQALDPADPNIAGMRGEFFFQRGAFDRAIEELDRLIRVDPNRSTAFYLRGASYEGLHRFDRAIEDFDQAIRLNAVYIAAWNDRCFSEAMISRLEQALQDCNEAMRLHRPDAEIADSIIHDSRGFVLLKLKQYDGAIADYDAALGGRPNAAWSLYGRGMARRAKGDKAGGDADVAAAQRIDADIAAKFEDGKR